MYTNNRLSTPEEEASKRARDMYIPGEGDYENVVFWPIEIHELAPGKLMPEWVNWNLPLKVSGEIGDGTQVQPYRPWRRRGKEKIYERLKVVPEQVQTHKEVEEIKEIPQPPMHFFDGVPNFSEIPLFAGNINFGQVEPERGWWGELVSSLSQAGTQILEAEKARYEAQIRAYQEAQKRSTVGQMVTENKTLLYLLLGGGLIYLIMRERGKKSKK